MTTNEAKIRGNDTINGARSTGDNYTHLAHISDGLLCLAPLESFFLTYSEVTVDCPECTRKLNAGEAQ